MYRSMMIHKLVILALLGASTPASVHLDQGPVTGKTPLEEHVSGHWHIEWAEVAYWMGSRSLEPNLLHLSSRSCRSS